MQLMRLVTLPVLAAVLLACAKVPTSPASPLPGGRTVPSAGTMAWGPETPNFNVQVVLRGQGFGLVKFRQPNDGDATIYLDTWVRDLAPNTSYLLQRAVDPTIDGDCTSTSWLTLGKGLTPQAITTDARGVGREALSRSVAAFPVGSQFDIHFRVIEQATSAVVLESGCYVFTISL